MFPFPLILDGAIGDELFLRGYNTDLPLWATTPLLEHPSAVLKLHQDYVQAGAQVLTANTFRTHFRTLYRAHYSDRMLELNTLAVSLAQQALGSKQGWVAGSIAPLEDCYRPDLVPSDYELEVEHLLQSQQLLEASADLLLIETMNCIREARIALRCAKQTSLPVWVSFLVTEKMTLPSGEKLADAYNAVISLEPDLILANCFPLKILPDLFPLLTSFSFPFGLYPNLGKQEFQGVWDRNRLVHREQTYVEAMSRSLNEGAIVVGGCCGTGPQHIHALTQHLKSLT
ncbi:MAG: homocysteine S-methyltransferase family protein [Planctomycetota bacterium]